MPIVQARPPTLQAYFVASSTGEALAYLMAHHGEVQVVAGGTALMPCVQERSCRARRLVDVSRIAALKRVSWDNAYLTLGGGLTFAALAQQDTVKLHAPLLQQAAELMGTPQVRRLATLAGNLVTADGNAHGAVALLALNAEAEITNATGSQWLPVRSLYVQQGLSRVDSTSEIVTALRIPAGMLAPGAAIDDLGAPRGAAGYSRAPVALAINLVLEPDRVTIDWLSAAIGVVGRIPQLLNDLRATIEGRRMDDPELGPTFVDGLLALVPTESAMMSAQIASLAARVLERALARAQLVQGSV